jgi:hypothetical protein
VSRTGRSANIGRGLTSAADPAAPGADSAGRWRHSDATLCILISLAVLCTEHTASE